MTLKGACDYCASQVQELHELDPDPEKVYSIFLCRFCQTCVPFGQIYSPETDLTNPVRSVWTAAARAVNFLLAQTDPGSLDLGSGVVICEHGVIEDGTCPKCPKDEEE